MAKKFEIRNSTAEFLTFVAEGKEQGVQVLYKGETVWATQKAMAQLFNRQYRITSEEHIQERRACGRFSYREKLGNCR